MPAADWRTILDLPNNVEALTDATLLLTGAIDAIAPVNMGTFNSLWGKFQGALRSRYQTRTTSPTWSLQLNVWRFRLALEFARDPAAPQEDIFNRAFGQIFERFVGSADIEDDGLRSTLWTEAEKARNGEGGANSPRRAQ